MVTSTKRKFAESGGLAVNVLAFQIPRPPSQSHRMSQKRLSQTERYQIYALMKVEQNLKTIAHMLCHHKSTVGRGDIRNVVSSGVSAPNIGILGAQNAFTLMQMASTGTALGAADYSHYFPLDSHES